MPSTYYPPRNRATSPSKRWQTTMKSSLDEVAEQLAGSYDRGAMIKGLHDRKMANSITSISFGNEKVNYISDTMDNQIRCAGYITPEERAATQHRIKSMKAELTTTNFCLGDEKPLYESVNHESMAKAEKYRGAQRVGMNTQLKEAVKKSSLHFGNEPVNYETVAHVSMQYRGNENNFSKLKQEVEDMKTGLRKHNFTFGDEKVEYISDYHRGYGNIPAESYVKTKSKKDLMRQTIDDSRRCHFSLGNDRPDYISNTHSALKVIDGHGANDISQQLEHAKEMKAALVRTSIVIGDDQEYF